MKRRRGFPGMAHALEHMMFRGNPDLSADQPCPIFSARHGGELRRGHANRRSTQYNFYGPGRRPRTGRCMSNRCGCAAILGTDELWDKERGAIEQEVAQDPLESRIPALHESCWKAGF